MYISRSCASCARDISASVHVSRSRHPASRDIRTSMYIIACIEEPVAIEKTLTHLDSKATCDTDPRLGRYRLEGGNRRKSSRNTAFVSAQQRNLGQHCVGAEADDGLMTWRYSVQLRKRALLLLDTPVLL